MIIIIYIERYLSFTKKTLCKAVISWVRREIPEPLDTVSHAIARLHFSEALKFATADPELRFAREQIEALRR